MVEEELIEMRVASLTVDPSNGAPIVVLKDLKGEKAIPIWVGIFEAGAIAMEIEGIAAPRPLTHDLFFNTLKALDIRFTYLEIASIRNNTFYANIHLSDRFGNTVIVDSRPSDGIALALRAKAPIFVSPTVISTSKDIDIVSSLSREELEKMQEEKVKEFLDSLSPEDFGKYKM